MKNYFMPFRIIIVLVHYMLTLNFETIRWYLMRGTVYTVKVKQRDVSEAILEIDRYFTWFEENCGKRFKDWDIKNDGSEIINDWLPFSLKIKISHKHKDIMTWFLLTRDNF